MATHARIWRRSLNPLWFEMAKKLKTLNGISVLVMVYSASAASAQDSGNASGLPHCPDRGTDVVGEMTCYCSAEARKKVKGGNVYGSGPYLYYSPVCASALHAGATGPEGGPVRLIERPPQTSFTGSLANGVFSADYGSSQKKSFDVEPLNAE